MADTLCGSVEAAEYEARRQHLKAQTHQSTIGQLVDDVMTGIERDNSSLQGVQHIIHHPAPAGVAGDGVAKISMSSNEFAEGEMLRGTSRMSAFTVSGAHGRVA